VTNIDRVAGRWGDREMGRWGDKNAILLRNNKRFPLGYLKK